MRELLRRRGVEVEEITDGLPPGRDDRPGADPRPAPRKPAPPPARPGRAADTDATTGLPLPWLEARAALTDAELSALVEARAAAWRGLGRSIKPLRDLAPPTRDLIERLSREYRAADSAVRAELCRRGAPVVLGERTLVLTQDGLHWLILETATGLPYCTRGYPEKVRSKSGGAAAWDYRRRPPAP